MQSNGSHKTSLQTWAACLLLVLSATSLVVVQCRLVDMSRDIQFVVRVHNDERMMLRAADMTEMVWDTGLQRQAEDWASRCVYKRPPYDMRVGANLYYFRDFDYRQYSVSQMVKKSMDSWISQKSRFDYSSRNCGAACLYVQMINARSNRIGCAVNTCENLQTYRDFNIRGTLFVCLYSPRAELRDALPYTMGTPCSRCRVGERCIGNRLCSEARFAEIVEPEVAPTTTRRPYYARIGDRMTEGERRDLISAHNEMRRNMGRNPLNWDPYLERWTNHVINCSVDYPGPRHTYTNFHRFTTNTPIGSAILQWQRDSNIMPTRAEHKCRTPYDREQCNHYSNMMQQSVSRMACSTINCYRNSRQMVCVYDNPDDRQNRLSSYRYRPRTDYNYRPRTDYYRPEPYTAYGRERTRWYRNVDQNKTDEKPVTRIDFVEPSPASPENEKENNDVIVVERDEENERVAAARDEIERRREARRMEIEHRRRLREQELARRERERETRRRANALSRRGRRGDQVRGDDALAVVERPVKVVEGTRIEPAEEAQRRRHEDGRGDRETPTIIGSAIKTWPSQG